MTEIFEKKRMTHLDAAGHVHMVDVSEKDVTARIAEAEGVVIMAADTLAMIERGDGKKGDVLSAARIAGIMAAKRTHELIPLCHQLALSQVSIDITPDFDLPGLRLRAYAKLNGKTGVEMEALTAVSVACLTIYDMAKSVDRFMQITDIRMIMKRGGKSGDWQLSKTE